MKEAMRHIRSGPTSIKTLTARGISLTAWFSALSTCSAMHENMVAMIHLEPETFLGFSVAIAAGVLTLYSILMGPTCITRRNHLMVSHKLNDATERKDWG